MHINPANHSYSTFHLFRPLRDIFEATNYKPITYFVNPYTAFPGLSPAGSITTPFPDPAEPDIASSNQLNAASTIFQFVEARHFHPNSIRLSPSGFVHLRQLSCCICHVLSSYFLILLAPRIGFFVYLRFVHLSLHYKSTCTFPLSFLSSVN